MKDIVLILFASSGFDKAAQGLTGAARRLADQAGAPVRAIVVGEADNFAAEVAQIADTVVVADQPELSDYQPEVCLNALTQLCRDFSPAAVLLSNDTYSRRSHRGWRTGWFVARWGRQTRSACKVMWCAYCARCMAARRRRLSS